MTSASTDELEEEERDLEALRARGPSTRHRRAVAAALGVIALAGALAFGWRRAQKPYDPLDSAEGQLLGLTLPKALVSEGRERKVLIAELGTPRAETALGAEASAAVRELLRAADVVEAARGDKTAEVDGFVRAATALDEALRKKKIPIFVDGDVLVTQERHRPLLMSYYIEREVTFEVESARVPAIHLWRLDRLRLKLPFLGFTRPRTPYALVVLDAVETDLVTIIGPSLKGGEPFELVDDRGAADQEPWMKPIEKRAGELLRLELQTEAKRPEFLRLADLLAERRALVRKWVALLPGLGLVLRVPERYLPEANYEEDLAHRVPRRELDEWERIHGELRSRAMLDAFLGLRRRFTGSVERHEVQHRIDYTAGLVPVPAVLAELLGVKNPLGAVFGSLPARARDELSAHLAQMADGGTPLLDILLLSRSLFRERFDAYSYAAWATLLGVGRELGKDVDAQIGTATVRSEQFGRALSLIVESPPHEIAAAARRFRQRSFGDELPRVRVASVVEGRAWRH